MTPEERMAEKGAVERLVVESLEASCELSNVMREAATQDAHEGAKRAMEALDAARQAVGTGRQYDTAMATIEALRREIRVQAIAWHTGDACVVPMEMRPIIDILAAHDEACGSTDRNTSKGGAGGA